MYYYFHVTFLKLNSATSVKNICVISTVYHPIRG